MVEENMLVYVIVPVYNVEKYLRRCLDSLFNQTYKDYLIICVNDGSTDNSLSILREYKDRYKDKMFLIDKPNGGLSSARNAGLDYITDWDNSYITFVDSDDWVSEDYLEVLVNKIEESGADIVCSSYYGVQESNGSQYLAEGMIENSYDSFNALKFLFDGKIQSHTPCKIYKSFLWNNFRFDEAKCFMEDQVITFQLFLTANIIFTTAWAGYFYLHRLGSLCQSSMSNKKILSALESYIFNYNFNFSILNEKQVTIIQNEILQQFVDVYLMMFPRFNKKTATSDELSRWMQIVSFEKERKAVKKFKCFTSKQKLKKMTYLFLKPLYKFLFSFFLKQYDY